MLNPAPIYHDVISYVYRMPSRVYAATVWQALNDDGTSTHLDDSRLLAYSMIHTQIEETRARRALSNFLIARSTVLANPIPLDPSTRASLLGELMQQAGQSRFQTVVSAQVMGKLRDLRQAPPSKDVDESLAQSGTVAFCKARCLPMADWQKELAKQK